MAGIGVVGTGHWGKNHARAYKELEAEGLIDIVKICDQDQNRARDLADRLSVPMVTDYRDLISDPDVDAVSIATPSATHYRIAREFMEAGKDVLVEKPMTMDRDEAKDLVRISEDNGSILMAGHIFRYHPAVRELKARIDAGELGNVQNIVSNRLDFGLPRRDMGVIYALGVHELDLFCHLLDRDYPDRLVATSTTSFRPGVEETCMMVMDYGGVKGYAFESWLVPAYGKKRDLMVMGSEKSGLIDYMNPAEIRLFNAKILLEDGEPAAVDDGGEEVVSIDYAEPLKEELKHFISSVERKQAPESDGTVGMRAVVMAEGALISSTRNRFVRFEDDNPIEERD
jgi:predicted dehydrogenase